MKLRIIFIFMLFSILFGCKTVKNTQISSENTAKIVEKEVIKYVKDSVFVEKTDTFKQFLRGDTMFITQIKWRNLVKYQLKSDTLRLKDSIFIDKVKINEKIVTEELPFYKRFWFGALVGVAFMVLLLFLGGKISQITDEKNELNN